MLQNGAFRTSKDSFSIHPIDQLANRDGALSWHHVSRIPLKGPASYNPGNCAAEGGELSLHSNSLLLCAKNQCGFFKSSSVVSSRHLDVAYLYPEGEPND